MFLFFYTGFWADWLCSAGPASQAASPPAGEADGLPQMNRFGFRPLIVAVQSVYFDCRCRLHPLFRYFVSILSGDGCYAGASRLC